MLYLIILLATSFTACNSPGLSTPTYLNNNKPLSQLINKNQFDKNTLVIKIDKSEYKLAIHYQGKPVKEYPVVFGTNPIDDKQMEGDRCTPEGSFKVRDLYPHKSWNKFIWIDYPTTQSWKKYNAAKAAGKIPKNAKIGGEIGIHGVPANADYLISNRNNWTWGCISLTNKDIDEIYPYVTKGAKIEIAE